jgi:prepilin-type N-terminal cleavage/methylation domain-containing protein
MKILSCKLEKAQGFSLVEMAVVLVILGFVIGALLLPLQAQRENTFRIETENQLEVARKALIGFAQTNGRLPCPATADSAGLELFDGNACDANGIFLPAATLGIQPTDTDGFAVDAWNNRIRYFVTQVDNPNAPTPGYGTLGLPDFIHQTELQDIGISRKNPIAPFELALSPDLRVCNGASSCSSTNHLINNAVAIVISTGANGNLLDGDPKVGPDEVSNKAATLGTTTFYSRSPQMSTVSDGVFDDMVVWISPYILYNAMIQTGQLY